MGTRRTHQAIHGSRVMYGQNHSQGGCVGVREGCLYRILREHPLAIVLGERNNNVRLRKDQDSKRLVVLPVLTGMYIYSYTHGDERERLYWVLTLYIECNLIWKGTTLYIEIHISIICIYLFLFFAKMCMYIYGMSFDMNVMHESHSIYVCMHT